jgi:redox-regulated HSP33 family molecular chaperone
MKRHWRQHKLFSTGTSSFANSHGTGDILVSGLNEQQDISVKVISCREIIQEFMIKQPMSTTAAKALGEVVACTLMMGSGLKNEESLQVNLVGKDGIRNVMAITDSGK